MSNTDKPTHKIGRTTRLQYWLISIFFMLPISFIIEHANNWVIFAVIPLSIPLIHAQIGRWHDLGHSGWLTLLICIPVIGLIASLPLCFMKGEQKSNQYGPSPYVGKFDDYDK